MQNQICNVLSAWCVGCIYFIFFYFFKLLLLYFHPANTKCPVLGWLCHFYYIYKGMLHFDLLSLGGIIAGDIG